ncbi:aquaporin [Zeugodacus cucurbitae]|uniref:Aquaporin n=1 Tax=Zeugodacus cucurbitae TaxID=28588 RepID=A0A0A1X4Z7_ZEUCU|nr:aquaporin [Zeugodacus cucurbitae]
MNNFEEYIGLNEFSIEVWRMLIAEFLGTFLYVFIGVISTISLSQNLMTSVVPVAFAFGLALSSISHVVNRASGAHLNPAVSIGRLVVGQMKLLRCLCYILVQCAGACLAAFLVDKISMGPSLAIRHGVTRPLYVGVWEALVIEIVITFLMVLVYKSMADPTRDDLHLSGPLVVGLSVTAGHLVGYLCSTSSMNPARSFGPALVNGNFEDHWIYWVGPISGGIIASVCYHFCIQDREALRRRRSRRSSARRKSVPKA